MEGYEGSPFETQWFCEVCWRAWGGFRRCSDCAMCLRGAHRSDLFDPRGPRTYCVVCWEKGGNWFSSQSLRAIDADISASSSSMQSELNNVENFAADELDPKYFQSVYDGRVPVVISGVHFHENPICMLSRVACVAEKADELIAEPEKLEAEAQARGGVVWTFHAFYDPPGILCIFYQKTSQGKISYRANAEMVCEAVEVVHLLTKHGPAQCKPDLLNVLLPPNLMPQRRFSFEIGGPLSLSPLIRDPLIWCRWDYLVEGRRRWRLIEPPTTGVENLRASKWLRGCIGDLGCGMSPLDLFAEDPPDGVKVWDAEQRAGDLLILPPGWWYQSRAEERSWSIQSTYMTAGSRGPIIARLLAWLGIEGKCAAGLMRVGTSGDHIRQARAIIQNLADSRPTHDHTTIACGPALFSGVSFAMERVATVNGAKGPSLEAFNVRMHTLLDTHATLAINGVVVPEDAPAWRLDDLALFVASHGFWRPARRHRKVEAAATSLRYPIIQKCLELPLCMPRSSRGRGRDRVASAHSRSNDPDAPRIIWMYWAQGWDALPRFRKLCVLTWVEKNPGWDIIFLDRDNALDFADRQLLPDRWEGMMHEHRSDSLRLALLQEHGGVWTDCGSICFRSLEDWVWGPVTRGSPGIGTPPAGLAAYYLARNGVTPGVSKEFMENWFFVARRAHPLIVAWRELYCDAWAGKVHSVHVCKGPLFQGVDLGHMDGFQRGYLTMHCCFKKIIDERPELRRIWADEMMLLRADDTSFAFVADVEDQWRPGEEMCARAAVFRRDDTWVDALMARTPMLKLTGTFARPLDWQPWEHLACRDNCIARLLSAALHPVYLDE